MDFKKVKDGIWELAKQGKMKVPARIFANEAIFGEIEQGAKQQLVNTAQLPGIQKQAMGMPDMHWGYGFPIGGVAAFDGKENGVVSPGGIGFDINCLPAGTKVLHRFGFTKNIEKFEESFEKERISCMHEGAEGKQFRSSGIRFFIKKNESKKIFKITTVTGKEIIATRDHPFFSRNGMRPAAELGFEDIAVYPFDGVEFKACRDKVIVDENQIEANYIGNENGLRQAVSHLKKLGLLPLKENDKKLPLLAKICGFVQGDGTLHFLSSSGAVGSFYGELKDLKEIKNDLLELGFRTHLYSRERHHKFTTGYGVSDFHCVENSLMTGSASLVALLAALGCTVGNKTKKEFLVPKWVLESPLWIKRLYLASFFGAELSSPKTVTGHGFNFYGPVLSLNKKQGLSENCQLFLEQIKALLEEFGVKSKTIAERKEYVNSGGEISIRFRLQISSRPENLERFWSRVGFEYNNKKRFLANAAVQYLRLKKKVLAKRKESISVAKALKSDGRTVEEIVSEINSPFVNRRFVERSLWNERKSSARVAMNFPKFEEFKDRNAYGLDQSGFFWDRIKKIEEQEFDGTVYDFTMNHESHNFIANGFLVSNCGVRLIRTNLVASEIKGKLNELMDLLFKLVPAGVGEKGKIRLNREELAELFANGAKYAVEKGFGWKQDLERIEENGCIKQANPERVSEKAFKRGMPQAGTLGSGNHFLEVQEVSELYDEGIAEKFGLFRGQAVLMLHSGSRGAGHQIATDYLGVMQKAMEKYGIKVPDKQLACAPIESQEGQDYLEAMWCGVNYAFANRQAMSHWARQGFEKVFGKTAEEMEMELVYDICHNVAKFEKHVVGRKEKELLVHRKGATRAMPPGRKENPKLYGKIGHPALIPGSMGTASYVLVGTETGLRESFASVCHGAGRVMSRHEAMRKKRGEQVKKELEARGEVIRGKSWSGLAEEMPEAYKDIDEVIKSVELAGIGRKVSRHLPLAVMKG